MHRVATRHDALETLALCDTASRASVIGLAACSDPDLIADARADPSTHACSDAPSHSRADTRTDPSTHARSDAPSHPRADTRTDPCANTIADPLADGNTGGCDA